MKTKKNWNSNKSDMQNCKSKSNERENNGDSNKNKTNRVWEVITRDVIIVQSVAPSARKINVKTLKVDIGLCIKLAFCVSQSGPGSSDSLNSTPVQVSLSLASLRLAFILGFIRIPTRPELSLTRILTQTRTHELSELIWNHIAAGFSITFPIGQSLPLM